ncbi:MAG: hypothetical protein A2Y23_07720 [Clostridiales bacterium GWB2_37_7]|nr:MAG: hypothetical protein A2Y23_07720 [Clostridiales bacterium GWB2_37_7]
MKKHKIIISILLTVLLLISTFGNNVFAAQDSTINTIGKNAAFYFTSTSGEVWDDVDVTSITPLYNFDDKLIAYSADLQNNKSGEEGYVIVSNIKGDGPI